MDCYNSLTKRVYQVSRVIVGSGAEQNVER